MPKRFLVTSVEIMLNRKKFLLDIYLLTKKKTVFLSVSQMGKKDTLPDQSWSIGWESIGFDPYDRDEKVSEEGVVRAFKRVVNGTIVDQ